MPTTAWTRQQQRSLQGASTATMHHTQQRPATNLRLQKQHSFTEANRTQHTAGSSGHLLTARRPGSGYLTRGLSVDRSLESIRQKLAIQKPAAAAAHDAQNKRMNKALKSGVEKFKGIKNQRLTEGKYSCVRAGSTSSLLKTLDQELRQVNGQLGQQYGNCNSAFDPTSAKKNTGAECINKNNPNSPLPSSEREDEIANSSATLKSDSSKVNLNIVLSHAINYRPPNGNESNNSDIDSCSEGAEGNRINKSSVRTLRTDLPARVNIAAISPSATTTTSTTATVSANATIQQRRAQFRTSRNLSINTSTTTRSVPPAASSSNTALSINQNDLIVASATSNNTAAGGTLNVSPSLIVQRRPPLVRAMSAPVRSRSLDENTKGVLAFQKRKLRRRKLISRNPSLCEKSEISAGEADKNDVLFDLNAPSGKKQPISRTRSTLAVDVITLVSLVSSEGSDSEKEDSAPETGRSNAERSRSTGMPSLRKTGKSVSFQENYPPNFQLATKEYSHMIRRGSIAPLAARLRSNRPPTAPPVSIFMTDSTANATANAMTTITGNNFENNSGGDANANTCIEGSQSSNNITEPTCDVKLNTEEYVYPDYVRSLKERECWKLYRKMSVKGVTVSYDTVLRGMLTPTEFRQIQKQREIEEAKARALEEEKEAGLEQTPPTSAVDRLTQKLLKK
ncbi:PREDICTED: uncharacterized protein LOC108370787 [Rhagoletis zephyria]|uniref:uncharacterized protein LOC108370787 n=1 Tax=Rhagoletis zephyria TaxID=28612 RepID=UPI000811603B|nr:PREDICTED: uncharacterized protein LOC108370787 [Rhagoletis zephyria]